MTETHKSNGSSFDDFLRDEGMYEEVTSVVTARVLAGHLLQVQHECMLLALSVPRK